MVFAKTCDTLECLFAYQKMEPFPCVWLYPYLSQCCIENGGSVLKT